MPDLKPPASNAPHPCGCASDAHQAQLHCRTPAVRSTEPACASHNESQRSGVTGQSSACLSACQAAVLDVALAHAQLVGQAASGVWQALELRVPGRPAVHPQQRRLHSMRGPSSSACAWLYFLAPAAAAAAAAACLQRLADAVACLRCCRCQPQAARNVHHYYRRLQRQRMLAASPPAQRRTPARLA